jgi:hypothetical protein
VDLSRHAAVLWRFRAVAAGGLALAVFLAILASYQPTKSGLHARGFETWQANSSILVTQPGFPEGRVTLPTEQLGGVTTSEGEQAVPETNVAPKDQVDFADPGRLASLADLYSKFLVSDDVLNRVPGKPTAAQIQASPFSSSQGGQVLPVIQLTSVAASEEAARKLNIQVFNSLKTVLAEQQKANNIAIGKRVEVRVIDQPEAVMTAGRKHTASILAFLLAILGTVAVCHLLAGIRDKRDADENEGTLLPLDSWDDPTPDDELEPPLVADERGRGIKLDW